MTGYFSVDDKKLFGFSEKDVSIADYIDIAAKYFSNYLKELIKISSWNEISWKITLELRFPFASCLHFLRREIEYIVVLILEHLWAD